MTRRRRGREYRLTEADLDRLAEITDEDKQKAAEAFRRDAPPAWRDLLDAEQVPTRPAWTKGRKGGSYTTLDYGVWLGAMDDMPKPREPKA